MGASWVKGWQCIIPRQGLKIKSEPQVREPDLQMDFKKGTIGRTLGIQDAGLQSRSKDL